jgi:hypothetical protein
MSYAALDMLVKHYRKNGGWAGDFPKQAMVMAMADAEDALARLARLDESVPSHTARTDDPDTARHAGAKHSTSDVRRFSARSQQARLLVEFRYCSLTAQEAAVKVTGDLAGLSRLEGCRRRVSDLVAAGYLRDVGLRRANDGVSDPAIVWTITAEGLHALDMLTTTGWSR